MKINEVETLAGITKKNIRFYEEQGLLCPRRNSENGYRDYCMEDVQILRRIRLLRKLGLPIEEIRRMLSGEITVGQGMREHMIRLERERRNLEQSISLCRELTAAEVPAEQLDADALLSRMAELEHSGADFREPVGDIRKEYTAPIVVTILMVLVSAALCTVLIIAYLAKPKETPPLWFLGLLEALFAAMGVGAVLALIQRIREIGKGELNDAKRY